MILPEHIKTLSPAVQAADPHPPTGAPLPLEAARRRAIDRFEQGYIEDLLRRTAGNVTLAARHAGVRRQHLQRLMARHGILSGRFTRHS